MTKLLRGDPAPGLSLPMSRRAFTFAGGALALAGIAQPGRLAAQGQARLEVVPGGTQAIPIAIPNFVAGTPADNDVGIGVIDRLLVHHRRIPPARLGHPHGFGRLGVGDPVELLLERCLGAAGEIDAAGFLVDQGEIVGPVAEITIAGNLLDMFAILEPGSDVELRHGIDSPTVLIPEMTVAAA